MQVVAYVTEDREAKLAAAVHDIADLFAVHSWSAALLTIAARAPDVVVLDPLTDAFSYNARVILGGVNEVGMCFYTTLAPESMRAALSVTSAVEPTIIFGEIDDSPASIRRVIKQTAEQRYASMASKLVSSIATELPTRLAAVMGTLFRHPELFANARALARAAQMSPTVMYETCARHLCPSPKSLLMAARVAHAYALLRGSKVTIEEVAERVGYHQSKIFVRHVHLVLGVSPTSLRSGWSNCQIRKRISLWLRSSHTADLDKVRLATWRPEQFDQSSTR